MTRYSLGRMIQFLGLLILPAGMGIQLAGGIGEGGLLLIMAAGAFIFYIGYQIQHGGS